MKKFIFLFLLAAMSISASAQNPVKDENGDFYYTISGTNATLVKHPYINDGYAGDVVIPDVMTSGGVEYNVTAIGTRAFCGCKILSVIMGKNVEDIYSHAFSYSTVASVVIGEGVKWIGQCAFYECKNLTSVVVGDNVTSISSQAFQNCNSLASVILGKNVRWIGTSAFADCENLKDIYCLGQYSPNESAGKIFRDEQLGNITLHVPEAYASYYNSSPWAYSKSKETMESTTVEKCATPVISYDGTYVSFTCDTEGAEFNSSVEYVESEFNNISEYPAPSHFRVKAVAVKSGYLPSDVAEQEFTLPGYVDVKTGEYKDGDVNKDSKVNVADHVKLTNIIMAP